MVQHVINYWDRRIVKCDCGVEFETTARNCTKCKACREVRNREKQKEYRRRAKERKKAA